MSHHDRLPRLLAAAALCALTSSLGCRTSGEAKTREPAPVLITGAHEPKPAPDETGAETGKIVAAPSNLVRFAPSDDSVHVDAATVNLKQVFEDLGPDATLWYQHVQTLANPFFEGREPGTRGSGLAAEYIEFYFRKYGLEPIFPAERELLGGATETALYSFRQPFDYSVRDRFPTVTIDAAELAGGGAAFAEGEDFTVLGNSASGVVTGPLSFAGYGIDEGPDGYTSFGEEADLTGTVAILLRYGPLDDAGQPRWDEADQRRQASIARKMRAVAARGAAAILLVNPPGAAAAPEGLEPLERSRRFGAQLDLPVLQITPQAADRLLASADPLGLDLASWQRMADAGEAGAVVYADGAQVTVRATVDRERGAESLGGTNVGGALHGRGSLAGEWIVITAHYDHVGVGDHGGIMPGNRGKLHPGADDNASGTAGVLVLAKMLSEAYAEADQGGDLRSILFLTFDGEEMGLKGSRHFANHPPIDTNDMLIDLNMDMIGRLRSHSLSVLGVSTGEDLPEILDPLFKASGMTVAVSEGGSGRSDDASFQHAGVPALHFFTGMHKEYTSPADQAYTVNPAGAREVLDLVYAIAMNLAARPQELVYQEAASSGPGQDRGYGRVRLGIRPGMGDEVETGVLVDAVSEGTSAAEGGMRGGDVIIAWNERDVESLQDLFELLQVHDPGDKVKITVVRDGEPVVLDVTLKASRPSAE